MVEDLKENGRTIRWKVMVFSHGLMVVDMKENILMTKKKVKVSSIGKH